MAGCPAVKDFRWDRRFPWEPWRISREICQGSEEKYPLWVFSHRLNRPQHKGEIILVLRRLPSQVQREIFGDMIRRARNRLGLTQENLAELMSCSAHWIHKVERGKSDLNWMDTLHLTVILDLDPAKILEEVGTHAPVPSNRK